MKYISILITLRNLTGLKKHSNIQAESIVAIDNKLEHEREG